jgi:hypothetical protein
VLVVVVVVGKEDNEVRLITYAQEKISVTYGQAVGYTPTGGEGVATEALRAFNWIVHLFKALLVEWMCHACVWYEKLTSQLTAKQLGS